MSNIKTFQDELKHRGIQPNTAKADELYMQWQNGELKKPEQETEPMTAHSMFDKHYDLIALFDEDMQQTIVKKIHEHFND